jgi:hypothetical protein
MCPTPCGSGENTLAGGRGGGGPIQFGRGDRHGGGAYVLSGCWGKYNVGGGWTAPNFHQTKQTPPP